MFDLEDDGLWKKMDDQQIKSLPPVPRANLMPPDIDILDQEVSLEKELKSKLTQLRTSETGHKTNWDKQLSYLLSTSLVNYEMERLGKPHHMPHVSSFGHILRR